MKLRNLLAITALLSVSLFAQKETPPVGAAPKDFNLPAKTEFTLPNGIGVTLVPFGTLPKTTISVIIRAGSSLEDTNKIWLAGLTGDMLKEGTTTKTSEEINELFASMGGEMSISTGDDQTVANTAVLSDFSTDAVKLVADILKNPAFEQKELDRLKKDLLRNLSVGKSRPQGLAIEKFRKAIYGQHPYGRVYSTEAIINGFTVADVKNFYEKNYGALRTHIYVAGLFDATAMKKAIEANFADIKKGSEPVINIPKTEAAKSLTIVNRAKAPQSTIYIGCPATDPSNADYMKLAVANTLLGGYFSSRITSNIREQKGYTYSPSSQVSTRYRSGYWLEAADVTTKVTGPAVKEIMFEINRLQKEAPTAKELDAVKNYLSGVFILQNSTRQGIVGFLSNLNLHKLPYEYLTNYVKNIYAVTPQEVSAMVTKYIPLNKLTLVVVGDEKLIEEQLKIFNEYKPE